MKGHDPSATLNCKCAFVYSPRLSLISDKRLPDSVIPDSLSDVGEPALSKVIWEAERRAILRPP